MKTAAAALAFLLAPLALSAQAAAPNQAPASSQAAASSQAGERIKLNSSYISPSSNVSGCPVSLRAQQVSSVDMVQIGKGRPQGAGQRLHLTLSNPDSQQVVAAKVTVRGYTFTPRVMNAVTKNAARGQESQSSYATRTIDVRFLPGSDKTVSEVILVPGVTAAQTIDLIALTYADGSTWELAAGKTCRIAPDPLMLVSAR
jgi:hypothetical protein